MKKIIGLTACVLLLMGWQQHRKSFFANDQLNTAQKMIQLALKSNTDSSKIPCTVDGDGKLKTVGLYDWRSGFFAGNIWYLYEFSKDKALKKEAERWTAALEPLQYFKDHHDLGFMVYCSYGNGYRITKNEKYKDIIVQAAKSLCTRFDSTTGCIKSWNQFKSWDENITYQFPVIIDNMMNLELLFFASEVTGDPYFKNIAITHANTTLKNHFRPDGSAYHVVMYNPVNGQVLAKKSAQGYADESAWSRGQAWALYGFASTYRLTKDARYLTQAIKVAKYLMNHPNLPADKVPFWDFNAGDPNFIPCSPNAAKYSTGIQPRDASAAAIIASALIELSDYVSPTERKSMRQFAKDILISLASPSYLAAPETNANFLLKHSVGSIPHGGEIDVPLVYADYYYLEALMRMLQNEKNKKW